MERNLAYWIWNNKKLFENKLFNDFSQELSGNKWFDRIFIGNSWSGAWGEDPELLLWIKTNRSWILEVLFRSYDIPDRTIKNLLRSDSILRKDVEALSKSSTQCQLLIKSVWSEEQEIRSVALLPDVAMSSLVAMHALIVLESALLPFELEIDIPSVTVTGGSVKLSISGGLFASGLSLLVACAEGLISTPLAIPAGIAIGTVGAIDLFLNWRKKSAEIELLKAEKGEHLANKQKLYSEAKKAEAEAKKLYTEIEEIPERSKQNIEERINRLERSVLPSVDLIPSASGKVDVKQIHNNSTKLGIPVWLSCHLLNRSIPAFIELSHLSHQKIIFAQRDKRDKM